jgi:DNA-directed RNA polymerase specialized sigma24 family protein
LNSPSTVLSNAGPLIALGKLNRLDLLADLYGEVQIPLWKDFNSLPSEAQQQVADFIAFLRTRYQGPSRKKRGEATDLVSEAFIGMWSDRAEMEDGSQWVREVRKREWM